MGLENMSRVLLATGFGLIAGVLGALIFLMLSPLTRMTLTLHVTSQTAGYSQVFVAEAGTAFAENRSAGHLVTVGDNVLAYPLSGLRGEVVDEIRWDPLDRPGTVEVTRANLSLGLLGAQDVDVLIRPSLDVAALERTDSGVLIATLSNDGQVLLDIDGVPPRGQLGRSVALTSLALGCGVGIMVFLASFAGWLIRRRVGSRRLSWPTWLTRCALWSFTGLAAATALGLISNLLIQ